MEADTAPAKLIDVSPAAIRQRQQADVRKSLRTLGTATIDAISEDTYLPKFSVKCRLQERPDWFEEVTPGQWRNTP